jgi:anti-sigma factor RsiW
MTDCPNGEIRDLLPDLLHDHLPMDVRREVEAHVGGCEECRAELALLGAMRSSLRRAPAVDAAAIAAAIPPYRAPVRRSWAGWRAAAAILVLAGGTSVAVLQSRSGIESSARDTTAAAVAARTSDSITPAATPIASAPADAPRELALGGSVVGDLDDGELSTLLEGLQTLGAVPAADVEYPAAITPLKPAGTE